MEFESIDVENYSFDVVRKGYDRLQVEDFLTKVGRAMARLEERTKLAEVRTDKAERELNEVRTRAEITIQETVAERAKLLSSTSEADLGVNGADEVSVYPAERAQIEARQIIERANDHATSIHAEAEAVLAEALSTSAKINHDRSEVLGAVGAEREELINAAREEAERIRTAAVEDAERTKAEAATRAEEIRQQAESDATELISEARARGVEITASAERTRDELLASAQRSGAAAMASPVRSGGDPLNEPGPASLHTSDTDDTDLISVDLRDGVEDRDLEPTRREPRASRYKSRSANLPHLGDDAGSVIGGLESLRRKDE